MPVQCPECGSTMEVTTTPALQTFTNRNDDQIAKAALTRHLKRCRGASDQDRDYYREHGKWPLSAYAQRQREKKRKK